MAETVSYHTDRVPAMGGEREGGKCVPNYCKAGPGGGICFSACLQWGARLRIRSPQLDSTKISSVTETKEGIVDVGDN